MNAKPSDNQQRPYEPGTASAEAKPWHTLESTALAVATFVEDDLKDDDWLVRATAV